MSLESLARKLGKAAGYATHYAKKVPARKILYKIKEAGDPYIAGRPGGNRAYIGSPKEVERMMARDLKAAQKKYIFGRIKKHFTKKTKSRTHKKQTHGRKSYYKSKAWMAKIRKMRK